MRLKPIIGFVLVPMAMAWPGAWSARGQEPRPPIPPSPALNLEYAAPAPGMTAMPPQVPGYQPMASNQAVSQLANPFDGGSTAGRCGTRIPGRARSTPAAMASEQGSGPSFIHGRRAVSQIQNPFESGYAQPSHGFLQQPSPQAATPQGPSKGMPGAAPGIVPGAPPGMAPGLPLGAGGVPGAPALPSTTTPEAGTPGTGAPGTGAPEAGAPPGAAAPTAADTFGEAGTGAGAGFGGTLQTGPTPFAMIGDLTPLMTHASAVPGPPTPPGPRGASPIFPSVRTFKLSENQSPRPQDRIFFNFNYYNNMNNTINLRDLSPVTQMKGYIYNFGIEKTFNNGMGSIGIRVPLDNLTANSFGNIVSTPTSTAPGNLTIFAKYILCQNVRTGSMISALWAITPQTATGRFAGAPYLFPLKSTTFQPALGYIYNYNRWYFQGFSGFMFSMNPSDVSMIYNDVAVGYFLIRNQDPRALLTALAPTVELHVNNPLNHRDPFNRFDLAGSPDSVDFTFGLNFGIRNTAVLTTAFAVPVNTPKPFDSEAVVMLNIFYGRTRQVVPITPPPM